MMIRGGDKDAENFCVEFFGEFNTGGEQRHWEPSVGMRMCLYRTHRVAIAKQQLIESAT
jgi:hypothetical protein